jgi:hypothetical protein
MGNVKTSIMYINNQQEVDVTRTNDGIQIKHRLISDDPYKPNNFSDYLLIPKEDLQDFIKMIENEGFGV